EIAQNTYDAFTRKHEELRVIESAQIGESNMIIISRAYPTDVPVAPRKVLNVAIAGVLGVMVGVFAAFAIEYWQVSGEEKNKAIVG
ncbi:GNVR domain-containing protein, partial [Stenotrophomonas maltophilia group sp. RNC7]|uniref:GNVR domain-containing protein n=1 Tax=Stenotrophomonas maltophilia group sp. RNC7 TaxID=3071467 RepID=UPI0027DFACB8